MCTVVYIGGDEKVIKFNFVMTTSLDNAAQNEVAGTCQESSTTRNSDTMESDNGRNQNAEEFFHQLNLSKCSNVISNTNHLPIKPIRKYPLTRYKHHAIIQSNKRSVTEPVPVSEKSTNISTKRAKAAKKRKTLSQKIVELKQRDPTLEKSLLFKQSQSESQTEESSQTENITSTKEEYSCTICKFQNSFKSEHEKHMKSLKHILKIEIEKGTDRDVLEHEKNLKTKLHLPYRCSIQNCGAEFTMWKKFIQHDREHKDLVVYKCVRCEAKFKHRTDLASHLKRHLGMKNIKCEQCTKTFDKQRDLVSHLCTEHGEKDTRTRNFKCTECGDAFLSKPAVDSHMRWHTGYRPETCQFCGSSFHTQFDLKEHIRIHTGEKPFSCDECNYKARTTQLLKRHKRKHAGEKPLSCKECDFTCSNSSALKRHSRLHTGAKPYKCPYCTHRCSNIENLRKHVKTVKKHTGLKIYPCSYCMSYSTDNGNEYLQHMKQHHFPYLDLKTATATKLSGIQVHDNDESENEEESRGIVEENLFERPGSLLCDDQGAFNLNSIQQSTSILPELGLRTTIETLNESDLRCLDSQIVNPTRFDKGDIFLSSMAPLDNHDPCKDGAFSSVPFEDESCIIEPFDNASEVIVQQPTDGIGSEINLSQGYLAVLVKWPNNQKVEVHQAPVEGVPLTLVVNSNSVYLKAPNTDCIMAKNIEDNITVVENFTGSKIPGSKTYIMSPNGLVLANENSRTILHSATFKPNSVEMNTPNQSCSTSQNNTFMTKSSIHVPNVPPNILTVSPEKDRFTSHTDIANSLTANISTIDMI